MEIDESYWVVMYESGSYIDILGVFLDYDAAIGVAYQELSNDIYEACDPGQYASVSMVNELESGKGVFITIEHTDKKILQETSVYIMQGKRR